MATIRMELFAGMEWDEIWLLYVLCSFVKAKSDVALEDVQNLVQMGLELFHLSRNKLYAQVLHFVSKLMWSFCILIRLSMLLNDYLIFLSIRLDGEIY